MRKWLLRLLLWVPLGALVAVGGAASWLWYSEAGAEWLWNLARQQLAASPRAARLDGSVSGSLSRGLQLDGISYRDADVTLTASRARLMPRLDFSPAAVVVPRLSLSDVEVDIAKDRAEPASRQASDGGSLATPLAIIVETMDIGRAVVRRGGFEFPIDSVAARGSWFNEFQLEILGLESPMLAGSGELEAGLESPYPLESNLGISRFTLPDRLSDRLHWAPPSFASSWRVEGSTERLDIEGTARWPDWMPEVRISGSAESLRESLRWTVEARTDAVTLPENWHAENGDAPEASTIGALVLAPLSLAGSGDTGSYDFTGTTGVRSQWADAAEVSFAFSGTESGIHTWRASGDAALSASGWPSATIRFEASQENDTITAFAESPALFGGALAATAVFRPGEERPWEGSIDGQNVSIPAVLDSLAPNLDAEVLEQLTTVVEFLKAGAVTTQVKATGTLEPVRASANIQALSAKLHGRDVRARGGVEYADGGIALTDLRVESGQSAVTLDGRADGAPGLNAQLGIANLGDFLPASRGRLEGRVHYLHGGERGLAASRLRVNLEGSHLQAYDWFVEHLELTGPDEAPTGIAADAVLDPDAPLAASLHALNLRGPAAAISTLDAGVSGTFERQSLGIRAAIEETKVHASLAGGFASGSGGGWSGTLDRLEVDLPDGETWALDEPAALRLSDLPAVEDACLSGSEDSSLCVSVEPQGNGVLGSRVTFASVPVDLLGQFAGLPFSFSQRLDGELEWTQAPNSKPSAIAEFRVSEGTVFDRVEGLDLLRTEEGVLRFRLVEGSLDSGDLDIPLDSGLVDVDFSLPDVMAGQAGEIEGRILLVLDNLDALANFVPQLVQTDGKLRADIRLSGSAGNPRLGGTFELHEGRMQVVAPGLRLRNIEVEGTVSPDNAIDFGGTFTAGAGQGSIEGNVRLDEGFRPLFDLRLTGEKLTLVDVPDLSLQADTDLTANWTGDQLWLSGSIHVPTARFAPRYQPSDTASESPDVVVVAGEDENGSANGERSTSVRVQGELEVSMGDDVVVDLDIARASMGGSALFRWEGAAVPIASGQYDLKGEIQAYGQNLEITRASIRFPNIPADNPHLDIRAERRIYGNSLITKAGVLVNGTLKRPQTEPYTVPPTNADRARALLITGSDFNYEQGVGAVNVGTYIAPRLYLSYGVGLFEEGNVITARYELRENLGVKATSGQDDTGIDISYTIER